MQIVRHAPPYGIPANKVVLTLGNFDGIHLGHQALVKNAIADARVFGVASLVLTFEPHPMQVLAPERAPKMLLQHKDKMQLLQSLGVDYVVVQTFDRAFAQMSARAFVEQMLVKQLRVRKVWVGRDLRFGKGRQGSVTELEMWGRELGYSVGIVEPVMLGSERVSSSRARELVNRGNVAQVRDMLGRYYAISGKVVQGHQRGRVLGFPTANIASRAEILPKDGIYATIIEIGGTSYRSVSSLGSNPTFGDGPRTVETYIMDFSREIYGEGVRLSFVQRIRDEARFATVDDLVAQIRLDVVEAQRLLQSEI